MSYNRQQEDRKRKIPKFRVNHGDIMRKGGAHGKSHKAERHSVHQHLHEFVVDENTPDVDIGEIEDTYHTDQDERW